MAGRISLVRRLTLNNAGVTHNAIGNYSGVGNEAVFSVGPPAGEVWNLARLMVLARGTGGFDAYNVLAPLTVGIVMDYTSRMEPGVVRRLDGGDGLATPAQANIARDDDWEALAYDVRQQTFGGGANQRNVTNVRFSFNRFTDDPMNNKGLGGLWLYPGDLFRMTLNDDFSAGGALTQHRFTVEGSVVATASGFGVA